MALPEVFSDPRYYSVLLLAIVLLVQYQRTLSWTEYKQIHKLKVRYFPLIGQFTSLFLISHKGGRDDAEYIETVDKSVKEVFTQLNKNGGSPHILCSIKKRPNPDGEGTQYSAAHILWLKGNNQNEAYLFENDDGSTDVYAHRETAVTDPVGHMSDKQVDGDPENIIRPALE